MKCRIGGPSLWGVSCYWAVVELRYSLADLTRLLGMTGQGVGHTDHIFSGIGGGTCFSGLFYLNSMSYVRHHIGGMNNGTDPESEVLYAYSSDNVSL